MSLPRVRFPLALGAAAAATLLSCSDHTGPYTPVPAHLAVQPGFASAVAGIVPLAHGRILITRVPSGDVAKDTVITIPSGADSVDLSLTVLLLAPEETFLLSIALTTPAGDTVFRAGPLDVAPAAGGEPSIVPVTFTYVGVGANAAGVSIGIRTASTYVGDTLALTAEALDSAGAPIPGTPIGWRSLDTATAAVPVEGQGRIVGRARGTARIVAELLTGQADTVPVSVLLPPAAITADSGSGQTAAAGSVLPQRLVARLTASDGSGVANLWVRFAVTLGGGTVSADSVLTDTSGRAGVTWTLGNVVGNQTVTATTARLPAASATFTANSTPTGPGAIAIVAGDSQSALVGTAVPTAPAVRVTDGQGNPVPNISVTFAVTQGGGAVTGATPTTDANGQATVGSWTLGPAVGLNALSASVSGLTPLQFVALGTGAGGATTMSIHAGNGQTVLAQTAVPIAPAVLLTDTAGAPVAGATVVFTVTGGGGTLTGDTAVSDAGGIAAVGGWTLGAPGANTLTASAAGLPDVQFQATGTVGAPDSLVIVSGDGQSADAGTTLPQLLTVEVRDSVGNPVPAVSVAWTTLNGSVTPSGGSTDAAGRAQASWTLGINALTQSATATASGLTPAVFTASAVFQNPSILLAFQGTDRIRLTDSALVDVTLTAPAPAGGVVLNFSVDDPAIVGLDTTDLSIPQNGTSTTLKLYGVSQGTTTVRATAANYADGALSVLVTVQVLSMPQALNVPYGGTASLPLQISTPAPVGGVTVTLVSSDPTAVAVATPSVTIPEGQQTANGVLSGVAPGTATITGSTTGFGIAQTAAATRANLNVVEGSTTIPETFTDTLTVRLESSGAPVAAPAPGITVTFTARDPSCVAATSPVTIPTGLVSATTIVTYGGAATTPCSTYLVAESPSIQPDSIPVTVNPPPGITAPAYTVGAGLQLSGNGYGTLGATNHGGVDVVIRSADPAIVLVSPDQSTVGGDSLVVTVPNGQQYFYYNLQALEGVADTGVAQVQLTFTAPGFTTATQTVTVRRPAFDLYVLPASTTTLSSDIAFYAYIGYVQPGYNYVTNQQPIRAGGQPATVTIVNDSLGVGQLTTTAYTGDTVTVVIPVGAANSPTSVAAGGVAYNPDNPGTTTISASIPGFDEIAYYNRTIAVSAPGITAPAYTVGAGLQLSGNGYGTLGATNHGGVDVVIRSADPGIVLVSPDQSTVGGDSLVVTVPNGQQYFYYNLQALEGVADTGVAQVQLTFTAPGFTRATQTVTVRRPAFDLYGIPTATTTLSGDAAFYAYIGYVQPGYTYVTNQQPIRAGGQAATVTIANGTPGVGRLVTSTRIGDTVTVVIPIGASNSPTSVATGGVAFDPLTAGTTTIGGSIPGFDEMPYYNRTVAVTAPGITLTESTVGSGLQKSVYGRLGATNHGGVNVVVSSSAPGVAVLSPSDSVAGTDSLVIFVPDGEQYFYYYAQGIEGQTGTVTTTARASGFTDGSAALNVVQPALALYGLPSSIQAGANSPTFYAQVGIPYSANQYLYEAQAVRAGGTTLTVTLTSSAPAVGQLVTSTQSGGTVTVQILPRSYRSPTSVAAGGSAFQPLAAGSTVVSGAIPGFITTIYDANRTVTVTP